jgi:hypothetical protein
MHDSFIKYAPMSYTFVNIKVKHGVTTNACNNSVIFNADTFNLACI